jgi:hypothetical protein
MIRSIRVIRVLFTAPRKNYCTREKQAEKPLLSFRKDHRRPVCIIPRSNCPYATPRHGPMDNAEFYRQRTMREERTVSAACAPRRVGRTTFHHDSLNRWFCLKEETTMNTLVLLVAASCTPAADPLPVRETRPYVPRSISAATQEWPDAPQESHPRFFARLRGLFSRRSRTTGGPSPELSGYSQGIPVNSTFSPGPITSPGTSMGDTNSPIVRPQPAFAPTNSPTLQRMPTGQPF